MKTLNLTLTVDPNVDFNATVISLTNLGLTVTSTDPVLKTVNGSTLAVNLNAVVGNAGVTKVVNSDFRRAT